MGMEKKCENCGTEITKEYCEGYPEVCEHWTPKKPMTNGDRFRAMSDEEIAQWLCLHYGCTKCLGKELCTINDGKHNGLTKWLKAPVEDK